ncbi:MAG: DMT family transporter [Alphaproteobacteria bacterium]
MILPFTRLRDFAASIPDGPKGAGYMLVSATTISGMNGTVQFLSGSIHVFEIAFFRQLFGVIFLSAVFLRDGLAPLITRRFGLHLLRAVLNVIALLSYFYGLSLEPLAKVVALSLTAPLFATVCAVIFLRERMTARRWIGLFVGMAGALIVLRPGFQAVSLGAMLVLLSNTVWAVALVVIKSLARTESAPTISLYAAILMTPITLAFALFVWEWPTANQLVWLVGIGVFGSIAQLCLSQSFRLVDATLVLPIDFTKIVWASLIGYVVFNQVPEIWVWIGATVTFAGVFYNTYQERGSRP